MNTKPHIFWASILIVSSFFFPVFADVPKIKFIESQALFDQGLRGNREASKKAYRGFLALVKAHPDNPLYLAYLGSNETIFARDNWVPWTRIKYLDRGLDRVDKALAMLGPEHDNQYERQSVVSMETRLVALSTFVKVPPFANRLQDAKDLFAESLATPVFHKAAPEVKQRIYLQGADIAARGKNIANEMIYLKRALVFLPKGYHADLIRKRLGHAEKQGGK